jgi:hypothetical protein
VKNGERFKENSMQIIVDYDIGSNTVSCPTGGYIGQYPPDVGVEPFIKDTDKDTNIVDLVKLGVTAEDLIKLKREGII